MSVVVHYSQAPEWQGDTACGRWVRAVAATSSERDEITCKACLARMT